MKVEQHLSQLLAAILPHVVFDGWSQTSFDCAVADFKMDPAFAAMIAPRGAIMAAKAGSILKSATAQSKLVCDQPSNTT